MVTPDKHKTSRLKGCLFNLLDGWAYDLEGVAAGARQIEKLLEIDNKRSGFDSQSMNWEFFFVPIFI
ncbi:hypothetical protein AN957_26435 [Cytobacillus solani]|uniref:Uncharacterized protein n=1 Tax=Cytobacillus solani TaxID=1637975 RepID=A0A0Q3SQG7_9BACI|nr:hypothetical protein AN957_26435 [Cytobacillus solani]